MQNDRKFITLDEKTGCSVHQVRKVQGNLSHCFQTQERLNQDTFSDREDSSLKHLQVFGSKEPLIRFSNQANVAKSLLDGKEIVCLLK